MKIEIKPSTLCGEIIAPPSKSIAHRFLICGALSRGESRINGVSGSDDMKATLSCLSALGASVKRDGNSVTIFGGLNAKKEVTLDCIESGSTLRFMIPVALASGAEKITFKGSERLIARGVEVYQEVFADKGVRIEKGKNEIVVSGTLESGNYVLRGDVSSQYVTGLMLSLATLNSDSTIEILPPVESRPYIDMTIAVLEKFGVKIEETEKNKFFVKGGQRFASGAYDVEGDWSNGAILFALNAFGSNVAVSGLDENSVQGDKVCVEIFRALEKGNATIDLSDCPDLAPIAFVVAAEKNGATFTGTERLKIKESDRAAVMAEELAKFGARVDVFDDYVVVHKAELHASSKEIRSHNDHRIAMSLAVLMTKYGGVLDGAEAVKKSFPDFFDVMKQVGAKVYEI